MFLPLFCVSLFKNTFYDVYDAITCYHFKCKCKSYCRPTRFLCRDRMASSLCSFFNELIGWDSRNSRKKVKNIAVGVCKLSGNHVKFTTRNRAFIY